MVMLRLHGDRDTPMGRIVSAQEEMSNIGGTHGSNMPNRI